MVRFIDAVRTERSDVQEFDMYALGADGELLHPADPVPRRTVAETIDVWRRALAAFQENARTINSPGGFVAPQVDFPTQTGFREDIQVTLHADPRRAGEIALEQGLLACDIRGLRVDVASLRTYKTELSWNATLRTSPWRRHRPAVLRLSPSPSFNVTVFRLTPVKSQRIATRAFIRAGLRSSYELIRQLEQLLGVPPQGLEP